MDKKTKTTEPKKIGLMFGSYNPPHEGHVETARRARDKHDLSEVWMMPVPVSAMKRNTAQADFGQKLDMCRLVTEGEGDWLKVSGECEDFKSGVLGQVQSIKRLLQRLDEQDGDDAEYSIVCGADFKEKYDRVRQFFGGLSKVSNAVKKTLPAKPAMLDSLLTRVEKAGQVLRSHPVIAMKRSKIYNPEGNSLNEKGISSSMIRAALAEPVPVKNIEGVPRPLMDYIQQNGLYGPRHD